LGDRVAFLGELPGSAAVRQEFLKADLFILPSASEGLPRVVIEAMAVGLPCIATTVGGTPELLPPEDMVLPGDVDALTAKIQEITGNPERMRAMSARNLQVAGPVCIAMCASTRKGGFTEDDRKPDIGENVLHRSI
jgi:glycosyltransferase involved in cell wall biosynthesis